MKNRTKTGLLIMAAYLSFIAALYFVVFTYHGTVALISGIVVCSVLLYVIVKRSSSWLAGVLAAIPLLLAVSCTLIDLRNSWQTNTEVESFYVGSMKRSYRIYEPTVLDDSTGKALIALHGFMQTAATMERLTAFNDLAREYGFIVIYPEGYRKSWNDGDDTKPATRENIDDIGFLSAIIDTLQQRYGVEEIYLTGFSNGGFLAVDAACQLADKIDGFAAVAAGTWEGNLRHCSDDSRIPAIFIQMKSDPLTKWPRFGPSVREYAQRVGCIPGADTTQLSNHQVIRYTCTPPTSVVHVTLDKGGHIWPGGPQYLPSFMIGSADVDFDASAFIVSEWLGDDRK